MAYATPIAALAMGASFGLVTYALLRPRSGSEAGRTETYLRAFFPWFAALSAYAVAVETYRPLFTWTWLQEAILGGDLVPITLFSAFLAFVTVRRRRARLLTDQRH